MIHIYDGVSSKKLIDGWNEGFNNATGGKTESIQAQIDQFNGYFVEEAKENDVYDIMYTPGTGVRVIIKGKEMGTIPGLEFKKAVFGIWLSEKTAVLKLRNKMLGK